MLTLNFDRRRESPRDRDNRQAAEEAELRNAIAAQCHTKFKVGQEVMLQGRDRVRIVAVEPIGFVSSPGQWGYYGRWCPAIINDREIYRYVHVGPKAKHYGRIGSERWHGQTTGDELSALAPAAAPRAEVER